MKERQPGQAGPRERRGRLRTFPLPFPALTALIVTLTCATLLVGTTPGEAAVTASKLWVKRYNGPANEFDAAYGIAVSADGSKILVTGGSDDATTASDYATLAYDAATGSQLWAKRYDGPRNDDDVANAIVLSPDGARAFVTGQSYDSVTQYDYATVAYDAATGSRLWVQRYDGPAHDSDFAYGIGVSPDGTTVLVTGGSVAAGTTSSDYATVAYDTVTGTKLWVKRYDGPGNGNDVATSIAVSPDGSRAFVAGQSTGLGSGLDYATVAYDVSTGSQLWAKRYDGPAHDFDGVQDVAASPDGSKVFATGLSLGTGSSVDYATVAYDAATGAKLWAKRYDGPASDDDFAHGIAVTPDGSMTVVTGESRGIGTDFDFATVAYDSATGGKLWLKRFGASDGPDVANDIVVSPDGSTAFVAGWTYGTLSDYAIVAYDATDGTKLWVKTYNGPGNYVDLGFRIAVSPDGSRAFITGDSVGSGTFDDFATVAYST